MVGVEIEGETWTTVRLKVDSATAQTLTRWFDLCHRAGVTLVAATEMGEVLAGAYGDPRRSYHTLVHVESCLAMLERVALDESERLDAELAVWFHDLVCEPTRSDNEVRSAESAKAWMREQGLDPSRVVALVSMTAGHELGSGASTVERAVHDVDLAILGAPAADYDEYAAGIRREYADVPDAAYTAGRRAVLARFLALERIFVLPAFRASFETQTRANLSRELELLGGSRTG